MKSLKYGTLCYVKGQLPTYQVQSWNKDSVKLIEIPDGKLIIVDINQITSLDDPEWFPSWIKQGAKCFVYGGGSDEFVIERIINQDLVLLNSGCVESVKKLNRGEWKWQNQQDKHW